MSNTTIAISLNKGANIDLTKGSAVKNFTVGLGWQINSDASSSDEFDVDAVAFSLDSNQKLKNADYITFWKQRDIMPGISLSKDNLVGTPAVGEDCETIAIEVDKVPSDVDFIYLMAVIHQAAQRNQNFGQINNAFVRVFETDSKTEIARFDLTEDSSQFNSFWLGSIYRHNGEWKFKAVGKGINGTIEDHANNLIA